MDILHPMKAVNQERSHSIQGTAHSNRSDTGGSLMIVKGDASWPEDYRAASLEGAVEKALGKDETDGI